MRKHSVRKWLHAVLDFLPLLVIPIFAIYTRNENYNSNIEVQVSAQRYADTNKVNTYHDLVVGNAYEFDLSNNYTLSANFTYEVEEFYLISGTYQNTQNLPSLTNVPYIRFYTDNRVALVSTHVPNSNTDEFVYYTNAKIAFICSNTNDIGNLVNYIKPYNEYNLGIITTIYNDTDVGSQFVYTLYNATDKYFNCTNLFNLEQVWNWVQLNLFGGNAPLMVYVVWQVIVYEFFMDLIFLLYSVFMFVIDFAENCLERPFDKIRRL